MALEFSKTDVAGIAVVTTTAVITHDDIHNIVVGIVEGGSNWMGINGETEGWDKRPRGRSGEPKSSWMAHMLLQELPVHLYDVEDDDEVWVLTLHQLIDGIQKRLADAPNLEHWDATDYDMSLQYALFGEERYC